MALRMGGTVPEAIAGLGREPAPCRGAGCLAGLTLARSAGSS